MTEFLTVAELARVVSKSEGYIRQHIHRGHLVVTKREDGHVRINYHDAWRWASGRGLSFDVPFVPNSVAHAMIVPFPISNLMTWCGYRVGSQVVAKDSIASVPEAVTCERCMDVMKTVRRNLEQWIPKLPKEKT